MLPVPNSPYGLCGRKSNIELELTVADFVKRIVSALKFHSFSDSLF